MDINGIWGFLINGLRENRDNAKYGFSTDGDLILCDTEEKAEMVADFLSDVGVDVATGHFDPEEDRRNGEVNECTGLYYVDVA